MQKENNMLINKLKTAGAHNYCRKAFVVYQGLDISLVSYGIEVCTIKKNGSLIMRCSEKELSVADKRHLNIFCKRFKHRMA